MAASWKGSSNIVDGRGVIPICGKKATMSAHIKRCPYAQEYVAKLGEHAREVRTNTENIPPATASSSTTAAALSSSMLTAGHSQFNFAYPPPSQGHTTASSSAPPTQIASPSPQKRLRTSASTPSLLPSAVSGSSSQLTDTSSCGGECRCACHVPWDPTRQSDFEESLGNVFNACNFPYHAAENPEFLLFFTTWLPGARIPDRRDLAGRLLDKAATKAIAETRVAVSGQYVTGQSDMWKNIAKTPILSTTMNANGCVSGSK